MNKVPKKYRKTKTVDSKISSIGEIKKSIDLYDKLSTEIRTIKDLFTKRYSIPPELNYSSKNAISRAMDINIEPNDIPDKNIQTEEDVYLTLFALFAGGNVRDKDGKEGSVKNIFGNQIGSVACSSNVLYLTRYSSLKLLGANKPQKEVKNIILFNFGQDFTVYLFTDASYDEIKLAPIVGLPDDRAYATYKSYYVERMSSCLNISNIVDNIGNITFEHEGLSFFESEERGLSGCIPPLSIGDLDEPWNKNEGLESFDILTSN